MSCRPAKTSSTPDQGIDRQLESQKTKIRRNQEDTKNKKEVETISEENIPKKTITASQEETLEI